jgi:hypothetical protein
MAALLLPRRTIRTAFGKAPCPERFSGVAYQINARKSVV